MLSLNEIVSTFQLVSLILIDAALLEESADDNETPGRVAFNHFSAFLIFIYN